jgi:hypothetical protein
MIIEVVLRKQLRAIAKTNSNAISRRFLEAMISIIYIMACKIGFRFFVFEKFLEHGLLAALGTHFT